MVFCLDKLCGTSHFTELDSCWPGEPKTSPKIVPRHGLEDGRKTPVLGDGREQKSTRLRDGRPRQKSTGFEDGRPGPARPPTLEFSARPPTRGTIFGDVLGSPDQQESSSAK